MCLVLCDVLRVKILDEENVRLRESKLQLSGHVPTSHRPPRSIHAPTTEVRLGEGLGSAGGLQGLLSPVAFEGTGSGCGATRDPLLCREAHVYISEPGYKFQLYTPPG